MAHAKTGVSLPVANAQELAQTWNGSGEKVPDRYVRTEEIAADEVIAGYEIPVIDLSKLLDPESSKEELAKLGSACHQLGFFQLINHGVPDEVIEDVRRDITEFFKLPLEAKKAHAQLPESGLEGYGQAFVFSDTQKLDWADLLYLMLRPVASRDMRFWPAQPPSFRSPPLPNPDHLLRRRSRPCASPLIDLSVVGRELCRSSVDRWSEEAAKVTARLLRCMAADMGAEPERLLEIFGGQPQSMRVTYYPPCTHAGKVMGLSPHTDTCGLTVLLHVNDVQGLQIRRDDGKWLAVEPLDGALTVNIGDILEMLSNGRYRSVEHRATVNPEKERMSAAIFHQVRPETTVGPLPELVERDGGARFKSVSHAEFMKRFFDTKLDGRRSHLEYYRI
ncbi:hypothetical protein ACP4OV_021014 [Aristida adscensionis]